MSRILREGTKVYAMDSLEDFGKYLVDKYGGKLIKHTSRIWIYEDKYGKRHALRIADESVHWSRNSTIRITIARMLLLG